LLAPKYDTLQQQQQKSSFLLYLSPYLLIIPLLTGTPERPVQAVQCTVCLLRDSARAVQQFSSAKKCPFDKRSALLDL